MHKASKKPFFASVNNCLPFVSDEQHKMTTKKRRQSDGTILQTLRRDPNVRNKEILCLGDKFKKKKKSFVSFAEKSSPGNQEMQKISQVDMQGVVAATLPCAMTR